MLIANPLICFLGIAIRSICAEYTTYNPLFSYNFIERKRIMVENAVLIIWK
jgi:hypothetical protein